MLRKGEDWGTRASGNPDQRVQGTDVELAAAAAAKPGSMIRFVPKGHSDIALTVGIDATRVTGRELPFDALRLEGRDGLAVNMVVVGTPPDELGRMSKTISGRVSVDGNPLDPSSFTTVVIANGEFLRGLDVVPRGHPGDGRAELQVYAVAAGDRPGVRKRLATGTHLPHEAILQRTGTEFGIALDRPGPVEVDGRSIGKLDHLVIRVVPGAYRLLV